MKISVTGSASFDKTIAALKKAHQVSQHLDSVISAQAQAGVRALSHATPADSGLAASSWSYEVKKTAAGIEIHWLNSDMENGFPVAIMIQYGHGTGTGGYVQGRDYINPAMRPIFDQIADTVWKAVISA